MKAIILAGGEGTRLRPITYEIPKPLLPVNGKPVAEHVIDSLKKAGIKEIILSVGYKKEAIKKYFGDGSGTGVRIEYIEENTPLGTGGAVRLSLEKKLVSDDFVVANGDILISINIKEMIGFHRKTKGFATIALKEVEDPTRYGVAELEGDRITRFVEKPRKEEAPSRFINAGIYVLNPEIANYIPSGFSMLEKQTFPVLASQGRLFGFRFEGRWHDIGTLESYETALKNWK